MYQSPCLGLSSFEKMETAVGNIILITVVRDEGKNLESVIEGVWAQSIRPRHWLILDDFSKDDTPRILKKFCARSPWMISLSSPFPKEEEYSLGFHIARLKTYAVNYMWQQSRAVPERVDYLALLDGDVLLPPDYFEVSTGFLERHPDYGMASPFFVNEFRRRDQISGGALVIRERCYRELGGIVSSRAFDSATMAKAKMLGWRAGRIAGLKVYLSRATSAGIGRERGFLRRGEDAWYLGFPFYIVLLRGIDYYLRGEAGRGLNFVKGYLRAKKLMTENIKKKEPLVYRYFNQVHPREILKGRWRKR